ncbi:MAG: zinc-ribbon domain-containing protein, partial [Gemmatimonadetes bacterium]|nr:zinc-ribbon domain-containing protein [Gemmatimonadota bacterium]
MGLVTCPDCQKEVSDKAAVCIHCGRPSSADLIAEPAAGSAEVVK